MWLRYGKDVAAEFVDFDATLCHLGQWQGVGVHLQHGVAAAMASSRTTDGGLADRWRITRAVSRCTVKEDVLVVGRNCERDQR